MFKDSSVKYLINRYFKEKKLVKCIEVFLQREK